MRLLSLSTWLYIATTLAGTALSLKNEEWIVGQEVRTTSGAIVGHGSGWKPLVSEYLGVRYAEPPVGDLRFAAPQPYRSNDTHKAATVTDSCPSTSWTSANATVNYESVLGAVATQLVGAGETFSEDCLGLSIWTMPQFGDRSKAVLIWVPGGSFNSGSQALSAYNGAGLANDHDVVVVTINYRLSVFGFPGSDDLDSNLALRDLRLSIEWVRDNIEQFGGDPSRITLVGQSAGGQLVDTYSYGWRRDPIINGLIMMSGYVLPWKAKVTQQDAAAQWRRAVRALDCEEGNGGSDNATECMRRKPWQELAVLDDRNGFIFGPTPDEELVFSNPLPLLEDGKFVPVPILLGQTDDEATLFDSLGKRQSFTADIPCAARIIAAARARHDIPAWHYIYAGNWPNMDIGIGNAWHASDVPMLFGTGEFLTRRASTADERRLSSYIGNAWTSFSKDPHGGLDRISWPVFDVSDKEPTNIVLGGNRSANITLERNDHWVVNCTGERGTL